MDYKQLIMDILEDIDDVKILRLIYELLIRM